MTITISGSGGILSYTAAGVLCIVQTGTPGNIIQGSGGITKEGAGVLAIATACTYSGPTTINNGTLRTRTSSNRLPTGTEVIVNSPGVFDPAVSQTVKTVNGNGAITYSGSGTLTINGGSGFNSTITGIISDGASFGNITKSGAGTLTLGGVNTYDGTFTLSAGTCTVNSGAKLCGATCDVVVNGGTMNLNNTAQTIENLTSTASTGTINLGTGHTLTQTAAASGTYSGTIAGAGGFTKTDSFNQTLSGPNSYDGVTAISGIGTITVLSATGLGSTAGKTTVASGAGLNFNGATTLVVNEPIDIAGVGNTVATGGAINVGTTLTAITFGGTITLTANASVGVSSAVGTSGTFSGSPAFTGSGTTLTLNGASGTGTKSITGAITLGSGGLTKLQSGTWNLSGVNTYTGPTTVSAGRLNVNSPGSLDAGSAVTVASTATLGGNGTINGLVTINSGGTLSPGASIGTLTLTVAPSLGGTTAMEVNKAAGPVLTSDKLVVSTGGGTLAYGGTLNITVVTGSDPLAVGDTFDLFDADAFSGSFTSVTGTPGVGLVWDTSQLTVDGTIKVACGGTLLANAGPDQSLCNLGSAVIGGSPTASGGSGTGYTYSWSLGTGLDNALIANPTASPTSTTIYTVTVTDSLGCTAQDSVTVTAGAAPAISAQPANATVCSGSTATFSVTASGPGTLGYSWAKNDNSGWGSAWATNGGGTTFRGDSTLNDGTDTPCISFSPVKNDINSPVSGYALGMPGGVVATRTIALAVGQVVSIDFDNGDLDTGSKNGFSLQTSSPADVLQFYAVGGTGTYQYWDTALGQQDTLIPLQKTGVRVEFALTSASAYTLIVTPCGGTATKFNGSYSGTIAQLKLFNENTTAGAGYDCYFNNFLVGGYTDNADNYSNADYATEDKGNQPIVSGNGGSTYTTPTLSVGDSGAQYQVVVSSCGGSVLSSNATVTVNALPTITLGANPIVCFATTSADLSYSATTQSPDQYSINFDAAAETAGFVDVVNGTLPASPITITVPGAAPAATYNGTLTVKNSTTGCVSADSAITVTINPVATVNAGPDQAVCASSPAVTLAGTIGGAAASATWSGGAGTFNPDNATLNATYTPTAGEITAGSVTLTLTTDDPAGPCGPVNDSMTITINPVAMVDAGPDQTVCASSPATTLAGSYGGGASSATWSGAGTFAPNATTMNAVYTPTPGEIAAGTVTVTLTTDDPAGPCGAVNDSMTITISPVATVNAGPDQTVCYDSPTVTLAGSFGGAAASATWSGAGTFTPDNTTMTATYTPTAGEIAAGTATVTLTTDDPAGPCGAVNDTMTITINAAPAITDQPTNLTVCASSPAIFSVGATGAGLTYQWQGSGDSGITFTNISDTATNASYTNLVTTVADSGYQYQVIVSGTCSPSVTSAPPAVLTVDAPATADAGPAQTVCASSPATTLAGSFGGGATSATWSGAGTFVPNAMAMSAVYTPTAGEIAAGTATVTLTSDDPAGPCGAVNDSMVITISPVATVNAGLDQAVCASSPDTTLAGLFGGAATSATWSGAGAFTPNATTMTAVYTPTAGEITAGTATVTLTTDDPAGPCGAVNDSMTITISPVATVNAGPDQTVCAGSPATILAGLFGGGATSATWSGAGTFTPNATTMTAVYTPTAGEIAAGTATVTLTTDDPAGPCGPVNDSMLITIKPLAPQPVIESITLSGTDATLVWSSVAGYTYRVQYTTDLTPIVSWTDLAPDVLATGATATLTDSAGAVTQRFYRIWVLCP
jgi:autotransporter-associated beta strand protein